MNKLSISGRDMRDKQMQFSVVKKGFFGHFFLIWSEKTAICLSIYVHPGLEIV